MSFSLSFHHNYQTRNLIYVANHVLLINMYAYFIFKLLIKSFNGILYIFRVFEMIKLKFKRKAIKNLSMQYTL